MSALRTTPTGGPSPKPSSTATCCFAASACCACRPAPAPNSARPFSCARRFATAMPMPRHWRTLQASLEHPREQNNPAWRGLLRSLRALSSNLSTLQRQLASASDPAALEGTRRTAACWIASRRRCARRSTASACSRRRRPCCSATPCAWPSPWSRVTPRCTPSTPSRATALLTTVFVCQPNYGATRIAGAADQRHRARPGGRLGAVRSVPSQQAVQAPFAVVAGVVFFATRSTRYTPGHGRDHADGAVLFNQVGDGYGLIWPRLVRYPARQPRSPPPRCS